VEHVVFFPAPDGTPAFRRLAGFEDAVRFVEHLRNVENVSEASVHELNEVPLSFRAWYRVELPQEQEIPRQVDLATPIDLAAPAESAAEVEFAAPAEAVHVEFAMAQPTTIAEAIESYGHQAPAFPVPGQLVGLPEFAGSATGIVVPDKSFAPAEQYGQRVQVEQPEQPDAQVLEPAFGTRRDRGIGFFAH
jgi:hypothetical protein